MKDAPALGIHVSPSYAYPKTCIEHKAMPRLYMPRLYMPKHDKESYKNNRENRVSTCLDA